MARDSGVVRVEAVFLAETDKAVIVDVDGEELIIPDSQITKSSEIFAGCGMTRGDEGLLCVTTWIAKKKGLA